MKIGKTVCVKFDDHSDLRKGEIADVLPHRSYTVKLEDGTTRRRTSRHVRISAEPPIVFGGDDDNSEPCTTGDAVNNSGQQNSSTVNLVPGQTVTRSGRVIKRPARYND